MPSRVQASYSRPTLPGWYARAGLPKTAFAASATVSSPAPASRAPVGEASAGGNGTGDATATVVVAFAGAGRAADTSHSLPEGGGGGRDTVDGAASPPGPDAPERPAAGRPDAPRSRLGCLRHGTCAAEVAAGESSILERLAKAPCEPTRNGSSGRARKQARLRRQAGRERRVPTVAGCLQVRCFPASLTAGTNRHRTATCSRGRGLRWSSQRLRLQRPGRCLLPRPPRRRNTHPSSQMLSPRALPQCQSRRQRRRRRNAPLSLTTKGRLIEWVIVH